MSLRSEWQTDKSLLEKAQVDTKMFKGDLASKLNDFESRRDKVDKGRTKYLKSDPAMVRLRAELKTACDDLTTTALDYEKTLHYLSTHAVDAAQKGSLTKASGFMLTVVNEINHARKL